MDKHEVIELVRSMISRRDYDMAETGAQVIAEIEQQAAEIERLRDSLQSSELAVEMAERDSPIAEDLEQARAALSWLGYSTTGIQLNWMAMARQIIGGVLSSKMVRSDLKSLAAHDAEVIERFREYFSKEYYGEEMDSFMEHYADKLRSGAKE